MKKNIVFPKPYRSKNKVEYITRKVDMKKVFDKLTEKTRYTKKQEKFCLLFVGYLLKLKRESTIVSAVLFEKFDNWFYMNTLLVMNLDRKYQKAVILFIDTLSDLKNKYNKSLSNELYTYDQVDIIFNSIEDIDIILKTLKKINRKFNN